jgi:hypothetical protein
LEADIKNREHSKSSVFTEAVSAERIAKFRQAIHAESTEFSGQSIAPPTFMTVFRRGEFELFELIGLKLESELHAEQFYRYESEIRAGDEVTFQTELTSVLEKKGTRGRLCFLTLETKFRAKDRTIGSSRTTIVVREKEAS